MRIQNQSNFSQNVAVTPLLSSALLAHSQCVCVLSSGEQCFELLSQVFVGAGEEDCRSNTIKRQSKKEHVCAQPRSKNGMEIVKGYGEQCGEVNPDQSHRQPADEQVRLYRVKAARLFLHGQSVFAEVNDHPQGCRKHDHQGHQGEVANKGDHINVDVNPVGEQRLPDDTSSIFCHVWSKTSTSEMEIQERGEHHAGGQ